MWFELLGGFIAFVCGCGVSAADNYITKAMTKGDVVSKEYYKSSLLRSAVNVVFVVAVYFLSGFLPWGRWTLLIGAILGITFAAVIYTVLLVKK